MNNNRIESTIKAYKKLKEQNPDTWLIACSQAVTIQQAIYLGANANNSAGKKHPHQYRIPKATLKSFAQAIVNKVNQVTVAQSFDELFAIVESCRLKGVSELTIYDTAQRIGSYYGLEPDKVYLHRGTRIGAKNLLGKVKGKYLTVNQLPQPFQNHNLSAAEIEDILCIYKERLKNCN